MVSQTRYAILGLLARSPGSGYELALRFGELFGPVWRLNRGQVYDMLHTLERDGLIEPRIEMSSGREVKRYRINEAGLRAFRAWREERCGDAPPHREAIYLKLALGEPGDVPLLLESIAMRKQVCLQRLRDCAESTAAQPGDEPEWAQLTRELISEATTTHLQAELQWLEQMHKRIQSRLAAPAEGRATLRPEPQRSGGKERAA